MRQDLPRLTLGPLARAVFMLGVSSGTGERRSLEHYNSIIINGLSNAEAFCACGIICDITHCAILVLLRALHESVPAGAPRGDADLTRCTLEPWTQALPPLHTLVAQSLDEVINCETDLLSAAHIRNDRVEVCVNNLESMYNNVLRE
eukprot:g32013.t1